MAHSLLLLPPHDAWPAWTGAPPLDDEDREKPYRLLNTRGYCYARLDLNGFPVNPAARAHPVFKPLDPLRALTVMLRRRPAVVICFFESSALLVLLLRRVFRFRGKVVVVDLSLPGWRPKTAILNLAVPRADAILPYSVAQAHAIHDTWPDAKLVYPVQAQVDPEFYAETPDQPDGPVLAVGDDVSRDYPTLLAAAGSVPHRIAIRSKRLQQDGLPPNVEILSDPLPLPAYRDLLGTASIMVLPLAPMVNGGGTSALVQAMACGKAVVVSASPGIADYVEDGVTGLVVPCHDPDALAVATNRLLTDHELRRRMGAAARQRALRLNSYEAWADTIDTVVKLVDREPG